jgi:hypothetical protein
MGDKVPYNFLEICAQRIVENEKKLSKNPDDKEATAEIFKIATTLSWEDLCTVDELVQKILSEN